MCALEMDRSTARCWVGPSISSGVVTTPDTVKHLSERILLAAVGMFQRKTRKKLSIQIPCGCPRATALSETEKQKSNLESSVSSEHKLNDLLENVPDVDSDALHFHVEFLVILPCPDPEPPLRDQFHSSPREALAPKTEIVEPKNLTDSTLHDVVEHENEVVAECGLLIRHDGGPENLIERSVDSLPLLRHDPSNASVR